MEKEATERFIVLSTSKINNLSLGLRNAINMAKIKQDCYNTFVDLNIIYSLIKDNVMLLIEFQDLINVKEKSR